MATIYFHINAKSDNAQIILNLSVKRGVKPKRKTGLFINPKNWSDTTNLPKQTTAQNKNLSTKLTKLSAYVLDKANKDTSEGIIINGKWLEFAIDLFFERVTENKKSDLLTDAIQEIIEGASVRKNARGGVGLSKSRINSYRALLSNFTEYQGNKQIKVKDIDIHFANTFLNYLLNTKNYNKGNALKKIADLKTVCNNAELNGIKVSHQLKKIQSSKVSSKFIIYLTTKELEQIENTELKTEGLQNARKWLLLGCAIGQRGGDLLRLSESNFINRNGLEVIELKQQKTGKNVIIPISPEAQRVVDQGLPYPISIQKFNNHIKEVCRISKIDKPTEGGLSDPETKRKIEGIYPKWKLIASHVCRRSFASNLYGQLRTPLIMQITAHSTEKMLLNYIGKSGLDYAQQIADYYIQQAQKQKQEPQLTVIKKASN